MVLSSTSEKPRTASAASAFSARPSTGRKTRSANRRTRRQAILPVGDRLVCELLMTICPWSIHRLLCSPLIPARAVPRAPFMGTKQCAQIAFLDAVPAHEKPHRGIRQQIVQSRFGAALVHGDLPSRQPCVPREDERRAVRPLLVMG